MKDDHVHRRDEHGIVHSIPFGAFPPHEHPECLGPSGPWVGRVPVDVVPTCLFCVGRVWWSLRP